MLRKSSKRSRKKSKKEIALRKGLVEAFVCKISFRNFQIKKFNPAAKDIGSKMKRRKVLV